MMSDKRFKKKLDKIKKQGERYKQESELRDSYFEYLPDKKKRKTSSVMLSIIVIAIIGYVIASFWLQYRTGYGIDSTITTCWFGFWTVEIVALTAIKTSKVKHGSDSTYDEKSY